MNVIRVLLLMLSAAGTILFGTALVASFVNPGYVEETAKEMIRRQVEKKVHEKIEALDLKFLSSKAGALISRHVEQAETARKLLIEKVPEKITAIISEMRNLDCECRKKIDSYIREGLESNIAMASQFQERLTSLIRTKYMETAEKLTREFRIFTGTNAVVFALLGIAAILKRDAGRHLALPALVLVVASTVTGYLYLFNQNWLHTILYSDYVGYSYILYLTMVFAFLSDILFNRARVTTSLISSVGGNIQVLPC